MKAIYTVINNNVYRVNQNTSIPTSLTFRSSGVSNTLNVDPRAKAIDQHIVINTLKKPGTRCNSEMYEEMLNHLTVNKITEVKTIQNFFKIYIDYTMIEDGREIEHSAVVKPIKPVDKVALLGIATNSECVYRRVKTFDPKINFRVRSSVPFGIMQEKRARYQFKINNIAIFQDFDSRNEIHESTYEVSYPMASSTIQANLNEMVMIYATQNEGIDIQPIDLDFVPRAIEVSLEIILSNYIVAYDHDAIDDILKENINEKYQQDTDTDIPDNGEDEGILIPGEETKPEADGTYEPDEDGFFDYYEKCSETTPDALLVVEDLIPDNVYDPVTMIKKSFVIKDIPEIEIGDYVVYRESFAGLI